MSHFKSQDSPDKWSEIIEDLWKHLSHFKGKNTLSLYDDDCDCKSSQFVDGEESINNDSVTWLHQSTIHTKHSLEEIGLEQIALEEIDDTSSKKSECSKKVVTVISCIVIYY